VHPPEYLRGRGGGRQPRGQVRAQCSDLASFMASHDMRLRCARTIVFPPTDARTCVATVIAASLGCAQTGTTLGSGGARWNTYSFNAPGWVACMAVAVSG
jgi:hypothetical protein